MIGPASRPFTTGAVSRRSHKREALGQSGDGAARGAGGRAPGAAALLQIPHASREYKPFNRRRTKIQFRSRILLFKLLGNSLNSNLF